MQKNVASQKLIVYVFDSTTNLPKTGDAANLTAYVSKDYGTVTVLGDTTATEMDATNAKGYYLFDLTQGETDGHTLLFSCKSATANMVCLAMPSVVFTTPPSFNTLTTNTIADGLLSRNVSNVEATMPEHCIGTIIIASLQNVIAGGVLTIYGTDGTTVRFTKTVTSDPTAEPLTSVS